LSRLGRKYVVKFKYISGYHTAKNNYLCMLTMQKKKTAIISEGHLGRYKNVTLSNVHTPKDVEYNV